MTQQRLACKQIDQTILAPASKDCLMNAVKSKANTRLLSVQECQTLFLLFGAVKRDIGSSKDRADLMYEAMDRPLPVVSLYCLL